MVFPLKWDLYAYWYKRNYSALYQMRKYLLNREGAILNKDQPKQNKRYLKINSIQSIQYVMDYFKVFTHKKPYNWYYSLASYERGIPQQKPQLCDNNNKYWRLNHWHEMVSYDYLIDVDAGDWNDIKHAKESTILIHEHLKKLNTPHCVRFSGKGFHLVIRGEDTPQLSKNPYAEGLTQYRHYQQLLLALHSQFSEMVDTGLADSRRLIKVPYSLAVYKRHMLVCHPITTTASLHNWSIEDADPTNLVIPYAKTDRLFCEGGKYDKLEKWQKNVQPLKRTMTD